MSDCRNCQLFCGDCGHHYVDEKYHIDYSRSSRACTSRTGMCEFFKDTRSERQKLVAALYDKWKPYPQEECIIRAAKILDQMSDEEFDILLKKAWPSPGGIKDEKD